MLSIFIIKDSSAAGSYYSEMDNYYIRDRAPCRWLGTGAGYLGLEGGVDVETFTHLLEGNVPDGTSIHNAAGGRRAGIDLTFSAPKSVSIQALIGGDTRLINAHETAVERTLNYVEGLAMYRVTENGQTRMVASHNLIVASFLHDLSRETDPQLHTHAVVINATQRADGQWRALEAGELLRQKMLVGAMYRSELAVEVQKLGYAVRLTHADGRFELDHISNQQIEAFSTRSQAIVAALAENGKTRESASFHEKQQATLSTRNAKGEVDREALYEIWQEKSRELGIELQPARIHVAPTAEVRVEGAREAVTFAIAHVTERQAVVTEAQLLRAALESGTGSTDIDAIRVEIANQISNEVLIAFDGRYTTKVAQEREREILAVEVRGRGAVTPVLSAAQAARALSGSPLNPGQQAAATLVMTTDSRLSAVQGLAGTGKTSMLAKTAAVVGVHGYDLVGVAPSAAAARELSAAGIQGETIAAFIQRTESGLTPRSMLVVDEAGMVSARDMREILVKAEAAQARVVLIGDVQQLQSVEAGKPFAQLQEAGIARVQMSEIIRQNDARLRQAVELAAHGDTARSLAILSRSVVEIDDYRERHQSIASSFAALAPSERDETLIVAGTRAARASINEHVRAELGLAGQGVTVSIMERKDLTSAQAKSSLAYQPGDIVQAQKAYPSLGLELGDRARVADTSPLGRVMLERSDGVQVSWRPAVQVSMTAWQESTRELSVGDVVRLTANDHGRDVVNGERAIVTTINPERQAVTLERTDGRSLMLDASQPLHLDHGYCSTVHAAQGKTVDRVLIEADTHSVTTNENAWYVAISRAREAVTVYTNDKSMLPDAISRESVKVSALELGSARKNARDDLGIGG